MGLNMYYIGDLSFDENYFEHHGILGQKWGIRRYQNPDGSLTEAGRARYYKANGKWTRAGRRKARKDAKKIVRTAERAVFNKQGKVDKAAESAAQRHSKISVATDYFYGDDDVERRETRATIRNIITNESGKTITEVETYYGKVKKNNFLSKLLYKLDDADYDKGKETEDQIVEAKAKESADFDGYDDIRRRETKATIRDIITNESGKTITEDQIVEAKAKESADFDGYDDIRRTYKNIDDLNREIYEFEKKHKNENVPDDPTPEQIKYFVGLSKKLGKMYERLDDEKDKAREKYGDESIFERVSVNDVGTDSSGYSEWYYNASSDSKRKAEQISKGYRSSSGSYPFESGSSGKSSLYKAMGKLEQGYSLSTSEINKIDKQLKKEGIDIPALVLLSMMKGD